MSYLNPNLSTEINIFEHFLNAPGQTNMGQSNVSGSSNGVAQDAGRIGVRSIIIGTGDVSTRSALRYMAAMISFGSGYYINEWVVKPMALSNSINNPYIMVFGFIDSNTADINNGAYFEYDTQNGGDFWRCCTANNSTRTKTTTSKAITTGIYSTFKVEVHPTGANVNFYIDGNLLATLTTNIFTAPQTTSVGYLVRKVSGTGISYNAMFLDSMTFRAQLLSGLYP